MSFAAVGSYYGNPLQSYVNTVFPDLLRLGSIIVSKDDFVIPSDHEEEGIKKL